TKMTGRLNNVVLVHGGFVDGSGWEGVYRELKSQGYNVTIVQNPTVSFADDVAVTKRAIAAQDGPVVLVGHSYGGVVITEAGNDPKVAALVYIAAFAADNQESVQKLIQNPPTRSPDSATAGRVPLSGSLEVRGFVRCGREAGNSGLHGGFPGSMGCRGTQRR